MYLSYNYIIKTKVKLCAFISEKVYSILVLFNKLNKRITNSLKTPFNGLKFIKLSIKLIFAKTEL